MRANAALVTKDRVGNEAIPATDRPITGEIVPGRGHDPAPVATPAQQKDVTAVRDRMTGTTTNLERAVIDIVVVRLRHAVDHHPDRPATAAVATPTANLHRHQQKDVLFDPDRQKSENPGGPSAVALSEARVGIRPAADPRHEAGDRDRPALNVDARNLRMTEEPTRLRRKEERHRRGATGIETVFRLTYIFR